MSGKSKKRIGSIGWLDLTVSDASGLRDFYCDVIGWQPQALSMGEYSDFAMLSPDDGEAVAGICHALGSNADLPSQWLVYIIVENVEQSARRCVANGGTLLVDPRALAGGRFCVIEDPQGAVLALFQESADAAG